MWHPIIRLSIGGLDLELKPWFILIFMEPDVRDPVPFKGKPQNKRQVP